MDLAAAVVPMLRVIEQPIHDLNKALRTSTGLQALHKPRALLLIHHTSAGHQRECTTSLPLVMPRWLLSAICALLLSLWQPPAALAHALTLERTRLVAGGGVESR